MPDDLPPEFQKRPRGRPRRGQEKPQQEVHRGPGRPRKGEEVNKNYLKYKSRDVRKLAFLEDYAKYGLVSHSCDAVGISRYRYEEWLQTDPRFVNDFMFARSRCIDEVEQELHKRAMISNVRERDTNALMFWLKHNYKEKYGDERKVKIVANEDLLQKIAELIADTVKDSETYDKIREGLQRIAAGVS